MDNLKLCEIHYLQGRHRQFKEKVPESLKLQRKRKNHPSSSLNNVEIRARKACKMAKLAKKKRRLSDGEALVVQKKQNKKNKNKNKKGLKESGDMQLELLRMVLKREVEKRKKNNKKNKKDDEEEEEEDEEEEELQCSEGGELRRELANGVMAISAASTAHDCNGNVGSHCDVKMGADCKALTVTPRYFRSKNVDRVPVGKLQVGFFSFCGFST